MGMDRLRILSCPEPDVDVVPRLELCIVPTCPAEEARPFAASRWVGGLSLKFANSWCDLNDRNSCFVEC